MSATIYLRSKCDHEEAERYLIGKMLDEDDYDVLVTGNASVYKPDGKLLCRFVKDCIPRDVRDNAIGALKFLGEHPERYRTHHRPAYSGLKKLPYKRADGTYGDPKNSLTELVQSNIIGYFDRVGGRFPFCRQTKFTAQETERWETIIPLAQEVARLFEEHVPDRYRVQKAEADKTHPAFVIDGTPFTTLTVNATVRAGCHYDKGDLKEGFGCINAFRDGLYFGHHLVFPEYRCAVDLQDCDLLFFDPHEMHGNTEMHKVDEDVARTSVVYYFRRRMVECGSPEEEAERAKGRYGEL